MDVSSEISSGVSNFCLKSNDDVAYYKSKLHGCWTTVSSVYKSRNVQFGKRLTWDLDLCSRNEYKYVHVLNYHHDKIDLEIYVVTLLECPEPTPKRLMSHHTHPIFKNECCKPLYVLQVNMRERDCNIETIT